MSNQSIRIPGTRPTKKFPDTIRRGWLLEVSHDQRLEGNTPHDSMDDLILKRYIRDAYRDESRRTRRKLRRAFTSNDFAELFCLADSWRYSVLEVLMNRSGIHPSIKEKIISNPDTDPRLLIPALRSIEEESTSEDVRERLRTGIDQRAYILFRRE